MLHVEYNICKATQLILQNAKGCIGQERILEPVAVLGRIAMVRSIEWRGMPRARGMAHVQIMAHVQSIHELQCLKQAEICLSCPSLPEKFHICKKNKA